jgi:hypothetical protein
VPREGGRKESLSESTESECFLTPAEKDSPLDAWKLSYTVTLGGIQFSQKGLMTGPELVDGIIECTFLSMEVPVR